MKITVTKSQFVDHCRSYPGRENQFTYEGLEALYDYFEEVSPEDMELDFIAMCCDYTEYASPQEAVAQYEEGGVVIDMEQHPGIDLVELDALQRAAAMEYLEEHTAVIPVGDTGRVIIANF